MTIVCGTDLSGRSRPAIAAAAAIARRTGAPLHLVHVVSGDLLEADCRERLAAAAAELLAAEAERVSGVEGGVVRAVRTGHPAHELLSYAQAERADLVVVSSQGHAASPLYRLGGTSERIASESPLPVLVVRDAAPFEAWARGERPLRVLAGVDFTASSLSAVRWVKALRRAGPCDVVFGHVYDGLDVIRRYGRGGGVPSLVEPDPDVERLLERDVAGIVGEVGGEGRVSFRPHLGLGRLADSVLELADTERADLVVVGTHHHRGPARLWSVSSGALHLARMSVATVPTSPGTLLGPEGLPEVKRVLVASDLSDASGWAITFGYALVARRGGEVHLLHVVQSAVSAEERSTLDARLASRLRALAPAASGREGVTTHVHVTHGPVVAEICEAAERLGVDAVCLGSRGESRLGALLGSAVAGVLRESTRPVLVVVRPPPA